LFGLLWDTGLRDYYEIIGNNGMMTEVLLYLKFTRSKHLKIHFGRNP